MSKEKREHKEINTRKYKQQIENLKLDVIDIEETYLKSIGDIKDVINILEDILPTLKGENKYKVQAKLSFLKLNYNLKIE